jgi:Zn-dependent M28 family amino/carboxypeptidase
LYLNFDMIASPNFVRFIYDGDESTFPAPVPVPEGSAAIEDVFQQFYEQRGLAYEDTEFNGRSDYQAFILNNIPAGGLFTGRRGSRHRSKRPSTEVSPVFLTILATTRRATISLNPTRSPSSRRRTARMC